MAIPTVVDLSHIMTQDGVLKLFSADTKKLTMDHACLGFFLKTPLMATFKNLEEISAVDCSLFTLTDIPCKDTIKRLFLDDNNLSGYHLESLIGFDKLTVLSLCGNHFERATDLLPLLKMHSLRELNLAGNPIVENRWFDAGMKFLFGEGLIVNKGADTTSTTIDDSQASTSSHGSISNSDPDYEPTMDSVELANAMEEIENNDPTWKPSDAESSTDEENESMVEYWTDEDVGDELMIGDELEQ